MKNRVYYGQYTLEHWLKLILNKNIILPKYQRFFVWDEQQVKTLIQTLKNGQFVPPITIGSFKAGSVKNQNLLLDGQQRLTSILLAILGIFPDLQTFKNKQAMLAQDNDDDPDEENMLDNVMEWDFSQLTDKGNTISAIQCKIVKGNYKEIDFDVDEKFLRETFLGFSFLVPQIDNPKQQQKYYSSVFRNINIQGAPLLPLESRAALYFLSEDKVDFFDPEFMKHIKLRSFSSETRVDFVRFMALLSQYEKDEGVNNNVAGGFKSKMEKYYEAYIYSVVGEAEPSRFKEFQAIFPGGDYNQRFENLSKAVEKLQVPKQYTSIIEMDTYLFGLIYWTIFQNKKIAEARRTDLKDEIEKQISIFKEDPQHRKSPGALKYLRARITSSVEIYKKYADE